MQSKTKTFLGISTVVGLTIACHYLGWLSPIENFFRTLVTPLSKSMYNISIRLGNEDVNSFSLTDLRLAYQKLKEENLALDVKLVNEQLLQSENIELKEQLNFVKNSGYQSLGAQVIGKNIDSLDNNIIINCGLLDGCRVNNPVIVGNGVLVGKIARVEDHISIVRLINDNQSKVAATIINKEQSLGLVEGGYGISVMMNYIPQNEIINVGDKVITSGLEINMPRGFLIGTVEAIEKEAYQPFQNAILKPLVNLDKILLVSVITTIK